ncbi:16S rRNA (adenine(1518)-N(6)/adenine(1519)-N(6))-dimethyltransferase RsmA [Limosilactobacillus sp.]|uniref:16S rRNA (adenine(1518)-N(6)/adenine(1519)-N(6))- dimethyltransferase RsmA n=1 Tax=Limosilactobacillus sp. TaxID=2773925 RepID=UPI00345EC31F
MTEAIGNLKRTRAIMKKYGLRAKKGYGQNFLTDAHVLQRIVDAAGICNHDNVIEIGPGLGALTEQLAKRAGQVLALEIDESLIPVLKDVLAEYHNVTIKEQDVMKANLQQLVSDEFDDPSKPVKVVANLPYYITSPILINLLSSSVPWAAICVMMQREVADRLTAVPGTKAYGTLTVAVQSQMDAQLAFGVSRHSFVPQPNVDSAIVLLKPRKENLQPQPVSNKLFSRVVRGCFAHRRKSLRNNLRSLLGKKTDFLPVLTQLGIDPQIRPEQLTIAQFSELTNALADAELIK